MRNFREYANWQKAIDFCVDVYKMTESFPKKETYALSDQLQRAAVSIPSNIAEGSSRKSQLEFAHFLEISLGSSFEVETQLLIAQKIGYISEEKYEEMFSKVDEIEKITNAIITKIRE